MYIFWDFHYVCMTDCALFLVLVFFSVKDKYPFLRCGVSKICFSFSCSSYHLPLSSLCQNNPILQRLPMVVVGLHISSLQCTHASLPWESFLKEREITSTQVYCTFVIFWTAKLHLYRFFSSRYVPVLQICKKSIIRLLLHYNQFDKYNKCKVDYIFGG